MSPTADGHFRCFPADVAAIGFFSTLNFVAGDSAVANGAIVVVWPTGITTGRAGPTGVIGGNVETGDFGIFPEGGLAGSGTATCHVVVDITSYFAP